ncbi:hypothetical protein GJ699_32390 [Duganella sp. FT80W]|uniref:Uncharacterized protein n=1 Tax=Duganella guangzhouensis TaxID=2666084 RepID=A0A6I2LD31_9BURK|nr:hypothetical protein [Duganella guangzhouensis]MRW94676.1 hypothetical protein [Duganella guangzhouensis]
MLAELFRLHHIAHAASITAAVAGMVVCRRRGLQVRCFNSCSVHDGDFVVVAACRLSGAAIAFFLVAHIIERFFRHVRNEEEFFEFLKDSKGGAHADT